MTITREGIFQLEFALLVIFAIIMIFKKVKVDRFFINLAFGLYMALIVAVCFFPITISGYMGDDMANNFIPFKTIIDSIKESVANSSTYGILSVFGNFVMLMPLGVFFQYYIKDFKTRIIDIALFSVGIETVQFIIGLLIGYNYRCIDIDDVILNVLGGIAACIFVKLIVDKYIKKKPSDGECETENSTCG